MISSVYHFQLRRVAPLFLLTLLFATSAFAESCLECHGSILKQFKGNSHHIQGVETSDRHCYACHWEATENGGVNSSHHSKDNSVDLVVWINGKRPVDYMAGKTAVSFTPGAIGGKDERTMVAGITVHCLSCHNDAALKSAPFAGDPNSPAKYAWDRESIASKYSSKKTTVWGKYSTAASNRKMQITKAFSAHGNAPVNKGGWEAMIGYDGEMPLTRGGSSARNVECFDCHNSHGSAVSGVTASYPSFDKNSNGGILKQTAAGQSGYKTNYQPSINSYNKSKNPFNSGAGLCFDCHETASSGATPWGYSSTFGATKPIMGYKDTAGFADGLKGSSGKYGSRGGRGEISSSHLKAGAPLQHQASEQINGLCTPCHDPHGISRTLGEDMDFAVPLLKGSWLTSPYKEDGPPDRLPARKRSGIGGDEGFNSVNRSSGSNFAANLAYNKVNRDAGSNFAKDTDYNKANKDAGSNFNKQDTDYNRVNRDAGSNFDKETDYNKVNKDAGSNFTKQDTDYNRVNRDAGSNFAKETDYNKVNKDAGSNFTKQDTDYNRVNRDAGSNFDKETDYNKVNKDAGSNFNKQYTDYNRVNKDAGSNLAKYTDYNKVNKDAGSNFNKQDTDYNRVNRDAGSNFAKDTDYNKVNKDAGSNFNKQDTDYNRVNRDAGSNFTKDTDYNKVNKDAGSNFVKGDAEYNRVNREASSNFPITAANYDRELDSNSTNRDANSNFGKNSSGAPREPLQGMKYRVDRNTFGNDKRISEIDTRFAGLCLKCHKKESLTGTSRSAMVHKTVKGWGNNKEHSFPCSKCHQAHNSGLPRLMQTNCFENGPPGLRESSAASWSPGSKESQPMKSGDSSGRDVGCHVKQFGKAGSSPENSKWREVSQW